MKSHYIRPLVPVALFIGLAYPSGAQMHGFPPESCLDSQQGQPGKSDVIAHRAISKGTGLECIQVESHPKHRDDGAACLLRFADGTKKILRIREQTTATNDGEVYLECPGDKPTRCSVGLYWTP